MLQPEYIQPIKDYILEYFDGHQFSNESHCDGVPHEKREAMLLMIIVVMLHYQVQLLESIAAQFPDPPIRTLP